MTAVVFETPGLIDVRAFTIMGAHAKPNSTNPIGYFGTGLKYALATLIRNGAEPVVWIGRDRFSFSKVASTFRGSPLETIKMRVMKNGAKRATSYELPFTTAMGKNWEVWMAFRELESNTRDESGRTVTIDQPDKFDLEMGGPGEGNTKIVVDLPEFFAAYEKRDDIFLPGASRDGMGILEAFDAESERLYYRTMRVLDISKPSIFTYNFLEQMELTEDRTLKYEFYAKAAVARWCLSEASEDQIERILKADEDAWEYGLEFPGHVKPSEAFESVMKNRRKGVSRNAWSYFGSYSGRSQRHYDDAPWALFKEHPTPWKIDGDEVVDANGEAIFARPEGYYDGWERAAESVLKRIRVSSLPRPEVAAPMILTHVALVENQPDANCRIIDDEAPL